MELPILSASKLKRYQSCPRSYWYEYIKKEPFQRHASAALGSAVHATIEEMHKNPLIVPQQFFSDTFNKLVEDEGLNKDMMMWSDGVDMVEKYKVTRTPIATEHPFTLEYPNKENPVCKFSGYIDQLYDWGFVDIKTNKKKPTQQQLDSDLQFIVYAWAYKQITGSDPVECIWYQARTGREMKADVVGKTYLVDQVIQQMDLSYFMDEYKRNEGFMCRFCPFRGPCLGIPIGVDDVKSF